MPRFMTIAKDDQIRRLKLALTFLFTQRSIPILYYGTEIAMEGGNDPDNRRDFPWGQEQHTDVRDLVKQLNQMRKEHIALRRGTLENLSADQWHYAYVRAHQDETAVVVLNNHATDPFQGELEVATYLKDGTVLRDLFTGKQVKVAGGKLKAEVGPRSGAIYVTGTAGPGGTLRHIAPYVATAVAVALVGTGVLYLRRRRR
jgi:hypothetical protein